MERLRLSVLAIKSQTKNKKAKVIIAMPSRGTKMGISIWEISLATANKLYNVAYIFLVIGAVFTAVSTIILFWSSGVRDKFASIEIAQAHASSDQAKSTAASANEAAAKATERVATLELQAEQERLRALKLQAQLAWRVLTPQQAGAITQVASKNRDELHIEWINGDPEARQYAEQIAKAFQAGSWQISSKALVATERVLFGLFVPDLGNDGCFKIRAALDAALLDYQTGSYQTPALSMGDALKPNECVLTVGSKAPPG